MSRKWVKGDKVVHASKQEWGVGEVLTAEGSTQDGRACQRLTVRFARAGLKTLSTAFAELKPSSDLPSLAAPSADQTDVLSGGATAGEVEEAMTRLPEAATDPFTPLRSRAAATLAVYKWGENPGLLLDWASIQTGLKDPLAHFNRHELEQWFSKFRMGADQHLRKLLKEMRKQDPRTLEDLLASATPAGKQAIRRADMDR